VIGGGYTEFAGFPVVHQKTKTEEPKTVLQQCQTGLTGGYRSDRWAGLTGVRQRSPETSKRRTRVGIAWLASRLRRVRSPGIRPMVKT
jgi:hypothetical protein